MENTLTESLLNLKKSRPDLEYEVNELLDGMNTFPLDISGKWVAPGLCVSDTEIYYTTGNKAVVISVASGEVKEYYLEDYCWYLK